MFTPELSARLARLLGSEVASVKAVAGGYSPAARWLIELRSEKKFFVKMGTTARSAEALRYEWSVYGQVSARFLPEVVSWDDDATQPLLVLEDLSSGYWPPPWERELVEQVCETLESLHTSQMPLRAFAEVHGNLGDGWSRVAADPEPFLKLGLVSGQWLERALPLLLEASADLDPRGTTPIHVDVRSDNICRAQRGVVLVDWNHACLGNSAIDLGFWLPSLEAEGGPAPEEMLPGRPDVAAWVSGYFAARAGLAVIPEAPRVRAVQLQQLWPALRWTARQLELAPPDVHVHVATLL